MRRLLHLLSCCAAVVAVYVALFFAMRDGTFITEFDDDLLSRSIKVHYFSASPRTNATLFYFFYPIHSLIGRPCFSANLSRHDFDKYQQGRPYYLVDPTILP